MPASDATPALPVMMIFPLPVCLPVPPINTTLPFTVTAPTVVRMETPVPEVKFRLPLTVIVPAASFVPNVVLKLPETISRFPLMVIGLLPQFIVLEAVAPASAL